MPWDLLVDRSDLAVTSLVDVPLPSLEEGEAVLRVDRVGLTANNVTYAVFGDAMNYWQFFPAPEGFVRGPRWGVGDGVASPPEGVAVGQRVSGYFPTSSRLLVQPGGVSEGGCRDVSPNRAGLPSPYNGYQRVDADPAYEQDSEDLQALYRPLFFTSFLLADFLADNGYFGAKAAVLSSASSKTAYGTAFLLDGIHRVGLTSPSNVEFTSSLACYDAVLSSAQADRPPPDLPTPCPQLPVGPWLRAAVAHRRDGAEASWHPAGV